MFSHGLRVIHSSSSSAPPQPTYRSSQTLGFERGSKVGRMKPLSDSTHGPWPPSTGNLNKQRSEYPSGLYPKVLWKLWEREEEKWKIILRRYYLEEKSHIRVKYWVYYDKIHSRKTDYSKWLLSERTPPTHTQKSLIPDFFFSFLFYSVQCVNNSSERNTEMMHVPT